MPKICSFTDCRGELQFIELDPDELYDAPVEGDDEPRQRHGHARTQHAKAFLERSGDRDDEPPS